MTEKISKTNVSLKIGDNLKFYDKDGMPGKVVQIDHVTGDVCIEEPNGLKNFETLDTIFDSWVVVSEKVSRYDTLREWIISQPTQGASGLEGIDWQARHGANHFSRSDDGWGNATDEELEMVNEYIDIVSKLNLQE